MVKHRADVLNDEVISALEPFFDWIGPRHDELTRVFDRMRVSRFDPAQYDDRVGKVQRVRTVLSRALETDAQAAGDIALQLISLIRSKDGFAVGTEHCPGRPAIERLRGALARSGYELTLDGDVRPASLEGLRGRDLTVALHSYVDRVREGREDPALVVGTAKDLLEATAKEALAARGVREPKRQFPRLLEQSFAAIGFPTVAWDDFGAHQLQLDATTEWGRLVQSLQVVGRCINDLRNAEGTGHGRASSHSLTPLQSQTTAEAAALIASLMLTMLDEQVQPSNREAG